MASASAMRQASNSSSPALNSRSLSAPNIRLQSKQKTTTNNENRCFKRRSLGEIFEVALDLLFHLRWHALLERLENFLAEVARRFVIFFTGQAEFFRVQ